MDLDDLLQRYFGTADLRAAAPQTIATGVERCQVDLGLETDPAKRFALWAMLYMLGSAPALDSVFDTEDDRNAARNFMDLLDQTQ